MQTAPKDVEATICVEFPADTADVLGVTREEFAREARVAAYLHWWSRTRLSLGRASELSGVSYYDLMQEIRERKIEWPTDLESYEQEFELIRREFADG